MALVLADRVRDTTTTTGTGTVTLSGTAPTGYQNFSVVGNGNTTYYTINAGSQWEVGIGTYSSTGPTLSRDTILASSSAGAAVDFAAGTKDVFVTYPAEKSVNYDASDNVGIGTTSPTYALSVVNDGSYTKAGANSFSSVIYMNKGRGSVASPTNISSGDNLGAVWFNGYSGSANNSGYGYGAYIGGAADGAVSGTTVPGRLVFATTTSGNSSPTERMRITSAGDVGIGTASPGFKLETIGGIAATTGSNQVVLTTDGSIEITRSTGDAYIDLKNSTGEDWDCRIQSAGTTTPALTFSVNGSERMRITDTGNVGIGTTGPGALLQLNKASGAADLRFSVAGTLYGNMYASSSDMDIFAVTAIPLILGTNNTERMRITSAGDVGLGTSSPQSKMEIRATSGGSVFNALTLSNYVGASVGTGVALYFDPNGAGTLARAASIQSVQSTSGNYADMRFFTANSDTPAERIRITPAGNVGIGTSNPVNKFEVVGPSGGDCIMINRASNAAYFQLLGASFPTYNAIQSLDGSGNEYWAIGGYGNANTMVFRTNSGTERMRITSGGNVAIGNSNAAPKFSVTLGTGFAWGGGWNTAAAVFGGNGVGSGSGSGGLAITYDDTDGGTIGPVIPGVAWKPLRLFSDTLQFYTNGATERMRIAANGNIGVNTTTPSTNFEINGGLIAGSENRQTHPPTGPVGFKAQWNYTGGSGETDFYNLYSVASESFRFYQTTGSGTAQLLYIIQPSNHIWYTGGTERMRLTSAGTLGLGLTAPNASLHIVGARGGEGRLTQMSTSNATAADALNIMASSSSGGGDQWYSWGVTSGNIWRICPGVGLGSSEAFSVNSNSRVMVGSATSFDTTVGANFMSYGSAGSAAAFKVNATSSTQVSFYDSTQSARVGWIGTSGSSTSYNTTSDRRLKQNIQPVGDVGDKIDQIEVVSHGWTNGTDAIIPYAFIAQDLYKAAPHAVSKGDDGEEVEIEWAVDYSKLVPMLVKELQSVRARLAELEGK